MDNDKYAFDIRESVREAIYLTGLNVSSFAARIGVKPPNMHRALNSKSRGVIITAALNELEKIRKEKFDELTHMSEEEKQEAEAKKISQIMNELDKILDNAKKGESVADELIEKEIPKEEPKQDIPDWLRNMRKETE